MIEATVVGVSGAYAVEGGPYGAGASAGADSGASIAPGMTVGRGRQLSERTVVDLATVFSALGEPTRLRLIYALLDGERAVGELAESLRLAVPAVSQHLRVLRALRIVRNRRAGRMIYYALDDAHVVELFAVALAHIGDTNEGERR